MTFQEAEQRFRQLEMQRRIRRITDEQYRAALNELRLTDTAGRLWMLQELTGQWHVYDSGRWVPATPAYAPAPPPPQPIPAAPAPAQAPVVPVTPAPGQGTAVQAPSRSAAPAGQAPAVANDSGGCGRIALYLVGWAVIWLVVAVAAFIWKGREEPLILAGVGLAALLSLLLMIPMLLSRWEGEVIEMRTERVKVQENDDDNSWHYENQTFAYIRQPSGRIRKQRAMNDWKVGDRLVKRRGDAVIRKV